MSASPGLASGLYCRAWGVAGMRSPLGGSVLQRPILDGSGARMGGSYQLLLSDAASLCRAFEGDGRYRSWRSQRWSEAAVRRSNCRAF